MTVETQKDNLHLIRNSAELNETEATHAVRQIGYELSGLLSEVGFDGDLASTFNEKIIDPIQVGLYPDQAESKYSFLPPDRRVQSDDEVVSVMVIGSLAKWSEKLGSSLQAVGFEPEYEGQVQDLTFGWMIAHELGHGMQAAHDFLHRIVSPINEAKWYYPSISHDYVDAHPEEKLIDTDLAWLIEHERQAEGIGSIYLKRILEHTGLTTEAAGYVTDLVHQTFPQSLNETNNTNAVGYAHPLSVSELTQRFAVEAV